MVKFMVFVVRRADMAPAAFRKHFCEVHGALAQRLPGLVGYRQNFPVQDGQASPASPPCDAIAELWFRNRAALDAVWDTEEGKAAVADNAVFMDFARTSWCVVEEDVAF